jgi:hypothetical protein
MSTKLPKLALSIRQPWCWAIMSAGKNIENRSWQAVNHGLTRRGRVCIHASQSLQRGKYQIARDFMRGLGIECPEAIDLLRGGIIGSVEVVDVVTTSDSPWFMGPRGLVLRDPRPCEFIPSVGALGYFNWIAADVSIIPEPFRWMLPPKEIALKELPPLEPQGTLL